MTLVKAWREWQRQKEIFKTEKFVLAFDPKLLQQPLQHYLKTGEK